MQSRTNDCIECPWGLQSMHRKEIQCKIMLHKETILALKPMRAQIDGCRAASKRAQSRKEKATLERAQLKVTVAETQVDSLITKLASLEVQVAKAEEVETPGSHSVEKLQSSLRQVLTDMSSSAYVDKDRMAQVKNNMGALLSGITVIAAQAQAKATVTGS